MKTFWKIALILWGITYSIESPEKPEIPKHCETCVAMSKKTTQTCDVAAVAKGGLNT